MTNYMLVNQNIKIKDDYVEMIKNLIHIIHRDFGDSALVTLECNQIIERDTNSLIKNVVKSNMINNETFVILINTIYFKSVWKTPFKKYLTKDKLFNEKHIVKMMNCDSIFSYYEDDKIQAVNMMYKNNNYGMLFVLPKQGIDIDKCSDYLFDKINFSYKNVDCQIPKFTQRKNIDLKPLFSKLGVTDLFHPELARLDKMSDEQIYISDVFHEAVVIVDEEGTEASAATFGSSLRNGTYDLRGLYEKSIPFYLDRPFLYAIKDNDVVLFAGDYIGEN